MVPLWDAQLAQGREKARQYLVDNPEFTKELANQIFPWDLTQMIPLRNQQAEEPGREENDF